MEIELLFTKGCPCWRFAQDNLKAAMAAEKIWFPLRIVLVENARQANTLKFLGSPSIRINGEDLWPEERFGFSLNNRIYITPTGPKGWPTVDMFRERLRQLELQV